MVSSRNYSSSHWGNQRDWVCCALNFCIYVFLFFPNPKLQIFLSLVRRSHAIVEDLARFGATVYTCSRNETELNNCLQEWEKSKLKVIGSVCDVSSRAEREKLMEKVSSMFQGKLNILVSIKQV